MSSSFERIREPFCSWMENSTALSRSSINHYCNGLNAVSNDMLEEGVIDKSLCAMSLIELDIAVKEILSNPAFIEKNKRGNSMYSNSLKQFRRFINERTDEIDIVRDINRISDDTKITATEKEVLSKARVGQGQFREKLFEKYNGKCIVTGVDLPNVLIASHIKPWSVSTNDERLSVHNGLLLSAVYDRLFDSGLISFKSNGLMIISKSVSAENCKRLNLEKDVVYDIKPTKELLLNLEYHRDTLFVK